VLSLTYETKRTDAGAPEKERRHYGIMIETLQEQGYSEDDIVQAIEQATAEGAPD
jgi:hypothetical protein